MNLINFFVFGLENKVIEKVFIDLNNYKNIKIAGSLSTNKLNLNIGRQFIEKDLYQINTYNSKRNISFQKLYRQNKATLEQLITRVTIKKISEKEIKNFYLSHLYFFFDFFKKKKINIVFFDSTPHFPIQFVVYLIAKILRIKLLILHRTDITNCYILKKDIKPIHLIKIHSNNKNSLLKINNYFKDKNISIWKQRSNLLNKRSLKKNHNIFLLELFVLLEFSLKIIYQETLDLFKIKTTESIFYYSKISFLKKIYYKISFIRKYQLINKFLDNISIEPNLNSKFIFFGLHFQPERSTLPEGGKYFDQYKAIKILSMSVDKDTVIYVKEHPRQIDLFPDLRKFNSRNINFYSKLLKLKNVYFVKTSFSSDTLVKKSFLNSTITGSIGSDSLRFKKPVILFAQSWYSMSNLCRVVNNVKSCKNAISYYTNTKFLKDEEFKKKLSNFLIYSNVNNYNKVKNSKYLLLSLKKILRIPK